MVLEVNGNGVGGVWPNAEQNASRTPEDVADVPVPEDDEEDLQQVVLEVGDAAVDLDDTVKVLLVDSDNRLHFRSVAVLRMVGEKAYISAGLATGELVCISSMDNALEGMTVRTAIDAGAAS